jgi:hypothetical protein
MNSKLLNVGWSAMIYKIGTDYWITNPKVGSRFLTNFSQLNGNSQYTALSITPVFYQYDNFRIENKFDVVDFKPNSDSIIIKGNYFNWQILAVNEWNNPVTKDELIDILGKTNFGLIRNPLERLKSGVSQMLVEWFFQSIKLYKQNKSIEECKLLTGNLNEHLFDINWNILYNPFSDDIINNTKINLDTINRYPDKITAEWKLEWQKFCKLTFDSISSHDLSYLIETNNHTQTFLYLQYQFLMDIDVFKNMKIIDINKLNESKDLILFGMTDKNVSENLTHLFGNPYYQESNIVFKDINWQPVYDWLTNYKLYTLEIQTFYNLLHNINE